MHKLRRTALAFVIVGAITWGLIGLFQFDLVATFFGGQEAWLSRIIYALVGLAGLYCLTLLFEPAEEGSAARNEAMPTSGLQYGSEFSEEVTFADETDDQKNPKNE